MQKTTRRAFFQVTGMGLGAGWAAEALPMRQAPQRKTTAPKFELGMASYTFRAFGLDGTLAMTRRLSLKRISLKSFHLPLEAEADEIRAAVAKVKASGLDLYAGGVIYMQNEAEARQAFDYAKAAGMGIIVGVPNHELLPLVNTLVGNYDIRVAIHNHGPTDKIYPTPESAYQKIQGLDRRIGLCIDAGHAKRSGIDPAADAVRFADRLIDVHIKDVTAANERGETCEMGRGVIDIPAFLRALIKTGYAGTVSLEYEKDEKDPLPGAAESIGYVRGVLASL
ncbi:MAG: sugar phosphate isomerase/epimerase [Acidobacteriia bacterium]|nr:sugar phosphate isomerase/epimerase [Terriglobia bacterium]